MATDIDITFLDYLLSKKIDRKSFQEGEPAMFIEWETLFNSVHPDSFTLQKKFLLNPMRRKYLLQDAKGLSEV
ncbi:MAG: hypothetical protein ACI9DJ_001379 [Algoriphagus sp.]|jgi:hypothetical protein